ncbi:MAG: hypothetical protein U0903_22960 [Planctomycetales bacterium]
MQRRTLNYALIWLVGLACGGWPGPVRAQTANWTPVRQLHAVDQWKMPKETVTPAVTSPTGKTPSKPVSAQPVLTIPPESSSVPSRPSDGPRVTIMKPVPEEVPLSGAVPGPIVAGDWDYWIVSARECDELAPLENCDDCLQFFTRREGDPTLTPRSKAEFLGSLQPNVPVTFFVHGSYITTDSVKAEAEGTYRWLKNTQPNGAAMMVFYTWPSDVGISSVLPVDLNVLGVRSENYSIHLGRLISRFPPEQPVSLVGHSHGGRLSAATMHLLAGGEVSGDRLAQQDLAPQRRMRMVLAAAAMDRHWMNPGEKFGMALMQPEQVLNLHNTSDYAMNIYPLHKPFGNHPLGGNGPSERDALQLGAWRGKIVDFNVAPLVGFGHTWPNYIHQPVLAQTVAPYVFFNDGEIAATTAKNRPSTQNPVVKSSPVNVGPAKVAPLKEPVVNIPPVKETKASSSPIKNSTVKKSGVKNSGWEPVPTKTKGSQSGPVQLEFSATER